MGRNKGDRRKAPEGTERHNLDGLPMFVHERARCVEPCPIHAPSDHHMVTWPRYYRNDIHIIERRCSHGLGHPDPDNIRVWADGLHPCDGCCQVPST